MGALFALIESSSKNLVHPCPYELTKRIGVESMRINPQTPMLSFANFRKGDYGATFTARDKSDRMIFYLYLSATISNKRVLKKGKSQ